MLVSGIYEIRNRVNGKRYVGSAVNLLRRQSQHLSALRRGSHYNQHLQRAFDKHGEATFAFTVLEHLRSKDLIEREQQYLDMLSPEYNISPTAGSPLGVRHTLETRRKISKAKKGHSVSEATRGKISRSLKKNGKVIQLRLRKELAHKLESLATLSQRSETDVIRLLIEDASLEQLGVRQPQR